jgi:hypothetical protein
MIGMDVPARTKSEEAAGEEKASVLTGAVVVQRRGLFSAADKGSRGSRVHRGIRAAFEIRNAESAPREHAPDDADVPRFSPVRGAEERDLIVAQPELPLAARRQQRHRLKRLCGGAQVDRESGVAEKSEKGAVLVHDRDRASMHGLDAAAPKDPGHDRKRRAVHR